MKQLKALAVTTVLAVTTFAPLHTAHAQEWSMDELAQLQDHLKGQTLQVDIKGMEGVTDALRSIPKNDPIYNKSREVLASLMVVSLMGQRTGQDTKQYDVSVSEDGRLLLNGSDLQKLIDTLSGM